MSQVISVNNAKLVELLRTKSREGFSILYDRYSNVLMGVIFRSIKKNDVAEEILQDVFVKAWKNFHLYDETKGSLLTWLLQITKNMTIDYLRSRQYKNSLKDKNISEYEHPLVQENAYYHTESKEIRKLTGKLEPKYREIIDMVYFLGYSQDEVSKLLNMPLGTVKTRSRTGLQILRSYFEEEHDN